MAAQSKGMRSVWAARLLGCAALAIILTLALSDTFSRPEFLTQQDQFEHVLAFSVLGFLFGWRASLLSLAAYALALTGVAFSIEGLQKMLTLTREAHLRDALASMAGLALGLTLAVLAGALASRRLSGMPPT